MKPEFIDLGLKLGDILIIADIHVGYEESLNKKGILIPRFQIKEILKRLEALLKKTKPKTVVINGDLKHEFGTISDQEWRDALRVIDLILKYAKKIVLVKGNHDKIAGPIAKKRDVEIVDNYKINNILILHGDKLPKTLKDTKTIIIGHEHPAVKIGTELRLETYKCFLVGKYKDVKLIVLPSFNLVTEGTDILSQRLLSPFLKQDISNFKVFVVGEDGVLEFGKIKELE